MPLDPSIYSNVGRVNLGQGLSDILDQQRQREMQRTQHEQTLASLAQQREIGGFTLRDLQRKEAAYPQQQADAERKRSGELRSHLYGGVQQILLSGTPDAKPRARAWGIAEAAKYGIPEESTMQALAPLDTDQDAATIAQSFDRILHPDIYAKQQAEAMFKQQEVKPQAPHYDADRGVWVMPPAQGKAVSIPVAGVQPKPKEDKSIDLEMKLADDYRMESKGFAETSTSMKKVLSAIDNADKNAASALAAGTAFMKILDPGSVVRETELGMALNASGWFDRAMNIVEKLNSGVVMTTEQKDNLKAAANDLFEEAKAAQREIDASYNERAKAYNLNPKRIIVDRGQNTIVPKKPPAGGWSITRVSK